METDQSDSSAFSLEAKLMSGEVDRQFVGSLVASFSLIIIIMLIFMCYFSREHIALSYKKWCEHRIR